MNQKKIRLPWRALTSLLLAAVPATVAVGALPTTLGWQAMPNTKIDTVCAATHGFAAVTGVEGCPAILSWSGGVFDTKRDRLIVWGGGHNAYFGNELYAFDLATQQMNRLNDPGLPLNDCNDAIAGGTQPASRHTYDGIEYMANVDRMFVFGGAIACAGGGFGRGTWTFDFATMQWQRMNPAGPIPAPRGDAIAFSAYDPNTGLIFVHDSTNLFSYDFNTNTYRQLTQNGSDVGFHSAATIDPKRRLFVIVGLNSNTNAGQVITYNIAPGSTFQRQTRSTTGGDAIIRSTYPGLDYDPVTDRIVAWNGGNDVLSLNLDSNIWSTTTFAGGPGAASPNQGRGTHGRWRYSAKSGVYVLVNGTSQDTFVFRLTDGAGTGVDNTPPAAPIGFTVR